MFYKLINGKWESGLVICLPNGEVLSEKNKINSDGWEWMDTPPLDFESNLLNNEND